MKGSYVENEGMVAAEAGPDTMEAQVRDVFLTRWDDMQADIVSATYLLDPLFVDKSKFAADCHIKLWAVARKVCDNHTHTHPRIHTLTPTLLCRY